MKAKYWRGNTGQRVLRRRCSVQPPAARKPQVPHPGGRESPPRVLAWFHRCLLPHPSLLTVSCRPPPAPLPTYPAPLGDTSIPCALPPILWPDWLCRFTLRECHPQSLAWSPKRLGQKPLAAITAINSQEWTSPSHQHHHDPQPCRGAR